MARKPYIPSAEEMRLKGIIIEQFDLWKSQGTNGVRNQKRVVSKCPALTEASLSRLLNINDAKCPSLDEAIEILMAMNAASALDSYIRSTNTAVCHYLRNIMKTKTMRESIETPVRNTDDLLININERLSTNKKEISLLNKFYAQIQGAMAGGLFVAYVIFSHKNLFLG